MMEERGHVLNILKETKKALKEHDFLRIKDLSNQVVHTSSIDQDPDVISVAVIIYTLSKILQRNKFEQYKNWSSFYKSYTDNLDNCIRYLEKNDIDSFRNCINLTRQMLTKISGNLKAYINEVFRKAQINKASRIYEHGISMEKTAKILGISVWELAEYAGQTRIADVDLSITLPIKQRIRYAEEVFEK